MAQQLLALSLWQRLAAVPLAYLVLWCALVALSITIVVLMRARWGQSRPLQKCAVLSLLVHLVFVCLAMTVRIVVGDGSTGSGPPIRVRIVDDSSDLIAMAPIATDSETKLEAPALLDPAPEVPQAADPTAAKESAPTTEPEPPETQSAPTEVVEPTPSQPAAESPAIADDSDHHADADDDEPTPKQTTTNDAASDYPAVEPVVQQAPSAPPVPVQPRAAGAYALRTAPGRLGLVESQGGNVQTEAAVAAALIWLAASQSPDGRWDADRFGAGREMVVLGQDRHGAGGNADTGISALALLAFLGAGHSHEQGDHQATVRRGLDYLIRTQATDGSIFGNAELYAQMYSHSMSTFALAEAAAMTGDKRLQPAVSRAINYCLRAQHPSTGGWRYRPGDTGDTSQLGWQMMALASAERAGLAVPRQTWTSVDKFLHSVRRGDYGGLASYRPDSPASISMTAEALYCRLLLSETHGDVLDEQSATEATGQLLGALPDGDRVNLYYWYYATLALHHRQQASDQAATAWHAWNDALTSVLLSRQVNSGSDAGSWNTDCQWGGYGGRVYTTAIAAMCLEVYYRHAPEPKQDPWIAARPDSAGDSR
ncbi:MAG: hypothetical protein WD468_01635 [Pirellulales bacterium]